MDFLYTQLKKKKNAKCLIGSTTDIEKFLLALINLNFLKQVISLIA
jgi:hypothetical protein